MRLRSLAALSLREPRTAMRVLLDAPLERGGRVAMLALASILTTLMFFGLLVAIGGMEVGIVGPLELLFAQAFGILLMSGLAFLLGRWAGGHGRFLDCILALSWLQILMSALQVAGFVVELALPFLGTLVGLVAMAAMMWLAANFIAEVHGFAQAGRVLMAIVGTVIALMAVLLALTNLAGMPNV